MLLKCCTQYAKQIWKNLQGPHDWMPVLVPLFVSAFRRAYELAVAMECRCYRGGDGRTRMKQLHMVKRDYICIVITLLVIACVVLLNIFGFVIYSLIRIK